MNLLASSTGQLSSRIIEYYVAAPFPLRPSGHILAKATFFRPPHWLARVVHQSPGPRAGLGTITPGQWLFPFAQFLSPECSTGWGGALTHIRLHLLTSSL